MHWNFYFYYFFVFISMDENVVIDVTLFKCGENFHDVRNCVIVMSAVSILEKPSRGRL